MHDEDLRLAVLQDVRDFRADQMKVERREIQAHLLHGQVQLDRLQ